MQNHRHSGHRVPPPKRIPSELASLRAWCAWDLVTKDGKPRKVPKHPDGRNFSTSRDTPYTLAEAQAAGTGVGLVLTDRIAIDGYTLVGFDVDACRDPETGALAPWAEELRTHHANTYAEVTPSGEGIRLLMLVKEPPGQELRKARSFDPAPNTHKRPEIETYGLGRACYVTLSGDLIPGASPNLERLPSLNWYTNRYPSTLLEPPGAVPQLPAGDGEAPDTATITLNVCVHPEGLALMEGRWEDVVPDASASEGFWRLVQRAYRAANGHGDAAVQWLLTETAYGKGLVDSAEPDRYRRKSWVAQEVARIAHKAPRAAASAFDAPFQESAYVPSEAAAEALIARERQESPEAALERDAGAILQVDTFAEAVQSREWLVDDFLPTDGLVSVFGKPGQGKTPFVLRLAAACAAELPAFFGRRMDSHGPVVYFVGEDEAGVRDRIVAQLNEIDPLLLGSGLPLYFTREPGRISDPENVGLWIKRVHHATGGVPPRLIVIDTLARNFGGGNESSTEDMQAFVEGCDTLSRALGKALVVCTHHPSKGNEDAGRGSGVLLGALDAEVKIELLGRTKLVATPTKIKGGPLPEQPFTGTLVPVREGLGFKSDGSPRSAITLDDRPPDAAAVFEEVINETDSHALAVLRAVGEVGGNPIARPALAAKAGVSEKVLRGQLDKLERLEAIEVKKGPSRSAGTSYLLTAQGSRVISHAQNPSALSEGPKPSALD